ncbi:hypothetical protein [Parafrankia sp. BMG5.11]|uniref:hypothetical protein n=1 Tax=Parafrankia sp. BMG5.11 TaxID=222540 RepID=UPI00103BFCFA|nr:hypothetical protein [Parafrankia sp. BMG5.11]TCJ39581.1 hypothetical protein E0504_10810 [Parafrankia sp. BMG5.11]
MTSEKQTEANRRNAQRSTGPRTAKGKAASSRNSLTHGVLSANAVSIYEKREIYQELLDQLIDEHDAQTAHEIALVERLANLFWRERRLAEAEKHMLTRYFDQAHDDKSYGSTQRYIPLQDQFLIGRYQGMLGRQVRDTLRDLREEQDRRMKTIEQAVVVTRDAER